MADSWIAPLFHRILLVFLIALTLVACGPSWRARFLGESVDQATRDSVTKRLGAPHFTRELDADGSVWVYQYKGSRPFFTTFRSYTQAGGSYCTEFILIFDEKKILREWRKQDCN